MNSDNTKKNHVNSLYDVYNLSKTKVTLNTNITVLPLTDKSLRDIRE